MKTSALSYNTGDVTYILKGQLAKSRCLGSGNGPYSSGTPYIKRPESRQTEPGSSPSVTVLLTNYGISSITAQVFHAKRM
jgi:hypothetical protein